MADEKISIKKQLENHLKSKQNFVLNGGAGSGKTFSLMEVIDSVYEIKSDSKIACITYTNIAADEISERVSRKNLKLRASTTHDFLWDIIGNYQKNLRQVLETLIREGSISYGGIEKLDSKWFEDKTIQYRHWKNLEKGIISHDEVLIISNRLFKDFPLLGKIIADRYDYIFIDEYQDTESQVIEIFLSFIQKIDNPPIIGLFGDSMQAIYPKGTGNIKKYIELGKVQEVRKEDNWRCSRSVISLINKIRDDKLEQKAAGKNLKGNVTFLYSKKDSFDIEAIKKKQFFKKFDFNDYKENKELYLTHKLIAKQFGFEDLLANYKYKENLTGGNPDSFISHMLKIQEIIFLYQEGAFNEFIEKTDFNVEKNDDLKTLKKNIDLLINSEDKTLEEVVDLAHSLKLVIKDDRLKKFVTNQSDQYNEVKDISQKEIVSLYKYRDKHSPYSTQHGVKGAEFENVFIILDNGKWNSYNFSHLFESNANKQSIVDRTRKLFYVCCSRAKKNLVVFFPNPSREVILQAEEWFEKENVHEI